MVLRPRRPGDPFVAKWVMERIKFAREIGDQGQADELEALFDETTLRQIIETDRWDRGCGNARSILKSRRR